jgi:hypothetical protein
VREIRLHGSEGGAAETNRSFLPLSLCLTGSFQRLEEITCERAHAPSRGAKRSLGYIS